MTVNIIIQIYYKMKIKIEFYPFSEMIARKLCTDEN